MAEATTDSPAPQGFHLEPRIAKAFLGMSAGFWQGATQSRAWFWTIGLAASLIASTYITVQMNHWNRWFFDALEKKDVATVKSAILVFFGIVACMAAIGVAIVITRETLQVRWRAWLVEKLVGTWLDRQRFYHLNASGKEPPNPEYRISDDTRWATEILVDLGIGLLSAVIGGIAFIAILWTVGGSYTFGGVTIPGYMVWLALAYGITASALMAYIGKPLVGRVGQKNEAEGYFRFAMMRLRDNAESIALMKGGPAEKATLQRFYDDVVGRWLGIVKSHGHITWITNTTGPMIPIIPLVFAAPKYLAGDLTLGQVTQLAAAFVQVQIAISWVVDNYNRIAEWYASARRVMDIVDASDAIDPAIDAATRGVTLAGAGVSGLAVSNLSVSDTGGLALLTNTTLTIAPGDLVHVTGDSGTGKSTLARLVAGLLAPSQGHLALPRNARLTILPQKPYVALGTLNDTLAYPHARATVSTGAALDALNAVGLAALVPRLHEHARWDQILSSGERQRLGLARLLTQKPDIIVLDDALSALEEPTQILLITALRTALPDAAILSLGQRPAPAALNARQLTLERGPGGAKLVPLVPRTLERV
jgi:vitamin B12/bleomycin/antimicrobial peptide transport system ATP-binding/permease protein